MKVTFRSSVPVRITTPALNFVGDMCLEFAYHMFGLSQGTLHAYVQTGSHYTSAVRTAFTRSERNIDRWFHIQVTMQTLNNSDRVRTGAYPSFANVKKLKPPRQKKYHVPMIGIRL